MSDNDKVGTTIVYLENVLASRDKRIAELEMEAKQQAACLKILRETDWYQKWDEESDRGERLVDENERLREAIEAVDRWLTWRGKDRLGLGCEVIIDKVRSVLDDGA